MKFQNIDILCNNGRINLGCVVGIIQMWYKKDMHCCHAAFVAGPKSEDLNRLQ